MLFQVRKNKFKKLLKNYYFVQIVSFPRKNIRSKSISILKVLRIEGRGFQPLIHLFSTFFKDGGQERGQKWINTIWCVREFVCI